MSTTMLKCLIPYLGRALSEYGPAGSAWNLLAVLAAIWTCTTWFS
jgi:hypothetical protein